MVYVFPEPVCPYANTVARPLLSTKGTRGFAVQSYTCWYRQQTVGHDTRQREKWEGAREKYNAGDRWK